MTTHRAARARGKREEHRIAELFGGKRRGNTGLHASDITDCPYAIEVKNVALEGIQGRWINQARAHSTREHLPWLLVVRRKGTHNPTVTLDLNHFLNMHQELNLLRDIINYETEVAP